MIIPENNRSLRLRQEKQNRRPEKTQVEGLIVKQGFTIVMIGIVLGLLAASALTNLLGSLLYGVGGNDPITIVASILVLCFAALLACSFPLRAVRIDPITALRE
jgi:putative ABC transport system permease protein